VGCSRTASLSPPVVDRRGRAAPPHTRARIFGRRRWTIATTSSSGSAGATAGRRPRSSSTSRPRTARGSQTCAGSRPTRCVLRTLKQFQRHSLFRCHSKSLSNPFSIDSLPSPPTHSPTVPMSAWGGRLRSGSYSSSVRCSRGSKRRTVRPPSAVRSTFTPTVAPLSFPRPPPPLLPLPLPASLL
jgi:hypothetical protein